MSPYKWDPGCPKSSFTLDHHHGHTTTIIFLLLLGPPRKIFTKKIPLKLPSSLDLVRETGVIIRVQPQKQDSFVHTTEGDEIMGIPMDHIFHNSQQA